jgi:hypothetical protein
VKRRAFVGVAAGIAAFAATATLALRDDRAATATRFGPEGVPTPHASTLAPPRRVGRDARIDGIACQTTEQVLFHIHAHLTIVVRGVARQVPAGIGIGGSCFSWLHTHAADGIVDVESPLVRTYTLGNFFDVWGQRLDRTHVGPARGRVTAFFDGRVFRGDPRKIPLLAHAQIQLDVGRALVAPARIGFPRGL